MGEREGHRVGKLADPYAKVLKLTDGTTLAYSVGK